MTTDNTQLLSTAGEDSEPDQAMKRRPRRALRFPMPEGESPQSALETGARLPAPHPKASLPSASVSEDRPQRSEHQRSREEILSPVAESVEPVEPEKKGEGGLGRPLRVPMPEGKFCSLFRIQRTNHGHQVSSSPFQLTFLCRGPPGFWDYWQPRSCFCVESLYGTP